MTNAIFSDHVATVCQRWTHALETSGFDTALIRAGESRTYFLDDQSPPFRPNPHFAQWLPGLDAPGSSLLLQPGARPRLYFLQPIDYWHAPPQIPDWLGHDFELLLFNTEAALNEALDAALKGSNRTALVGEDERREVTGTRLNPAELIARLHWARAVKTEFEITCMREATRRAVNGHCAARSAWQQGASEFEIHLSYLAAAGQVPEELPYPSIIAQNEHGGILHYQHYDRTSPATRYSFLIDAGASARNYAADITRTYVAPAAPGAAEFDALVQALDTAQQQLIAQIRPGVPYLDLHRAAHLAIAEILTDQGIVRGSAESAVANGLTRAFLPHGLGHLLGLQTHDVGGLQADPIGTPCPPPPEYPSLRLTRTIEAGQVFTIEPGLYFIPMLLDELAQSANRSLVDWAEIERLRPFGGIRIEDNVVVQASGILNLTREAFAEAQ